MSLLKKFLEMDRELIMEFLREDTQEWEYFEIRADQAGIWTTSHNQYYSVTWDEVFSLNEHLQLMEDKIIQGEGF